MEGLITHESVPSITMDPHTHLPSTWRTAIGPLLTNRRIRMREAQGFYGKAAQQRALLRITDKHEKLSRAGVIFRCVGCDTTEGIKYLHWSYLPKAGWYCPRCLAVHRIERDREENMARALAERIRQEYV